MRATGIAWASTSMTVSTAASSAREGGGGGGHRLGRRLQAQRDLGDQPERALAADEQPREVVAGARLAGPRARADDLAVGGDHGEAEDVLAHRAVADARSFRTRRWRPSRRCVASAPGSTQKNTPSGRSFSSSWRRVTPACTVTSMSSTRQPQDPVHQRGVDRHAAVERGDVAFEARAGAEGDDRRAVRARRSARPRPPPRCRADRRRRPARRPSASPRRSRAGAARRRR